ncbi:Fc.00g026030.m01.CDS01 [Cosmosporella sp. VM-42]
MATQIKDQAIIAVAEIEVDAQANVHSLAKRAVNAAVEVFAVKDGQAYVPRDLCPREILSQTLRTIAGVFELKTDAELDLTSQKVLHRIDQAMFDTDTQDFMEQESSDIYAHLTPEEKDRILAQAIVAATSIFGRLAATGKIVTWGLLNREAQLYAESDQRSVSHDTIEDSLVFDHCRQKSQIADMIMDAMDAEESPSSPQATHVDENVDFCLPTTAENMGLPSGFHVMAIN